ncbi:MAG: DNA polymerase III subunit chi [Candidatus Puniceispirillales bacterium]
MAQIAFYQLQSRPVQDVLPPLLQKTRDSGNKAEIIAPEDIHDDLSQSIWTQKPDSWLPHMIIGQDHDEWDMDHCPIWITDAETDWHDADIFRFYVAGQMPSDKTLSVSSGRMFIVFDGRNDESLASARSAWKSWRDHNHDLSYFEQDDQKGWVKKF